MLSHLFNIFIIYIQQEYHCQGWVEYVWVRLKAMATTKVYFCRSEEVSTWRGREDDPVGHCWFCSKYYHPASSCKKTDYNDRCSQEWGGQITIMKQSLSNNISWHCHGFKSSCYRSMVLILANVSLHKLPFLWPHSSEALNLHFWTASKVLDLLHSRIGVTIMICIAANWFYHKLLCMYLSLDCHLTFDCYCWRFFSLFSSLLLTQLLLLRQPCLQLSLQLLYVSLLLCARAGKRRWSGCCRGLPDTNISDEKLWSKLWGKKKWVRFNSN